MVIITAAVFASTRHPNQWSAQRHWIQTSMAPVLGIVVFLPLVMTVIVQIIWRFRSTEFAYCWIPRTPVHARWLAVDGWRLLTILVIVVVFLRIAFRSITQKPPTADDRRRFSAIDSTPVSIDGRGLFSQSMHNVHRWAWSKLGLTPASPVEEARQGRSYYETFKRSFVLNIVRRLFLTVDIPSPTLPESIFNHCGSDQRSITHCDRQSARSVETSCHWTSSSVERPDSLFALKRWCSALSRLVARPSSQLVMGHSLRRSHTAPVLTSDGMGLCSCVFKRPSPQPGIQSRNQTLTASPPPCTCYSQPQIPRSISVKRRHDSPPSPFRCRDLSTLDIYSQGPFSEYSESARIVEIETVEKLVSLEDGHWTKVVEKCRDDRSKHASDPDIRRAPRISRMYVYPLAYLLVWLPSVVYNVLSTFVYFTGFQSRGFHTRGIDMGRLPAHWTPGDNMNRMWPYYQRLTAGVWGSEQLGWLAILQSLHMLSGAVDALLFWLTE
ncbi:hypothetical protein IWW57_002947 [Coemansia sp. S610]|nr:hypothetical protein LPJ60_004711 [Coemansia sp. RSA 2675]KAJ2026739.1 hypothetical protein IWW57_002947 [Coemansia sp. S610]KAJ2416127.1 hypothetical protein GGI10_001204 [Coemansia sp. RSA 2530]